MQNKKVMRQMEKIFKSVASLQRIKALLYIHNKGYATVTNISAYLKMSDASTSRHMTQLHSAGFLDKERSRGLTYYRVTQSANSEVKRCLQSICHVK